MEMYKILQKKPLESYKNWFLNLALPQFSCSEPLPPAKTTTVIKEEASNRICDSLGNFRRMRLLLPSST